MSSSKAKSALTPISKRLIEAAAVDQADQDIMYQHTLLCQTGLPFRDPGTDIRRWERVNGNAVLLIRAGDILDPKTKRYREIGLPFGPKPRLILAHLNTEALKSGSAVIETEKSLTQFLSQGLGLDSKGRNFRAVKDQLARLSASRMTFGMAIGGRSVQVQTQVVSAFDVWLEKDDRQRALWPSTIQLSADYFKSLQRHAVPLDAAHLAALSHSAMALDVYSWLAQRLYRVPAGRSALVSWQVLADQFGGNAYDRLRAFRAAFLVALGQVLTVYRRARLEVTEQGLKLRLSPPPVAPRLFPTTGL